MGFGGPISNRSQIHFLKDFSSPKSSACSPNLNSGVFGKLNLENTFWPKYFYKKILDYTIHVTWSFGRSFGSRRRSIRVGGFIWFLEHLQTIDKIQSRQSPRHAKVLCHENQGVTDLPPLQESRPPDSQTRRGEKYGTYMRGSLHVLIHLLLPSGAPLNLNYLMAWLCI